MPLHAAHIELVPSIRVHRYAKAFPQRGGLETSARSSPCKQRTLQTEKPFQGQICTQARAVSRKKSSLVEQLLEPCMQSSRCFGIQRLRALPWRRRLWRTS